MVKEFDPETAIKEKAYTGTTGNLCLEKAQEELDREEEGLKAEKDRTGEKLKELAGFVPDLAGGFLSRL
jgi:hypothetical protein